MDFAIRTISFAISMRISSPQLQRRQGPDMGGWGKLMGGGRWEGKKKAACRWRGQGTPHVQLHFPVWPRSAGTLCIDKRAEPRWWLLKSQTLSRSGLKAQLHHL